MTPDTDSPNVSKRYRIGDVGPGARVAQGENITWTEGLATQPGGAVIAAQIAQLLAEINQASDLDDASRTLAAGKTEEVANALADVDHPSRLHMALLDARSFLGSTVGWAWDKLGGILRSEAAGRIISGISEGATRAAIEALLHPK